MEHSPRDWFLAFRVVVVLIVSITAALVMFRYAFFGPLNEPESVSNYRTWCGWFIVWAGCEVYRTSVNMAIACNTCASPGDRPAGGRTA